MAQNNSNMNQDFINFDVYQMSIITGIKLKALFNSLSEDQKAIYKIELEKGKDDIRKLIVDLPPEQQKSISEILNVLE